MPQVVFAEQLELFCSGSDPDWQLSYSETSAEFSYDGRTQTMEIPQRSTAEGTEWPQAATLIAPRDSAIIILNKRQCGLGTHEMHVLTQRGETPLLLTGCCQATER